MGLSSAVQWWQEWQLRILVLGSLFIQFILCYSRWVRRVPTLRRLRVLVWIAYIGGDALAVYALATLFNRHKQRTAGGGSSSSSSALEVVWAPVLLIHLGGQPTISAYSLEDNELWKRHSITLVSQVTVALYVFCKWWSGEKRLLQAAVLLFAVGIIKFSQKPWALKKASYKGVLASSAVSTPRREEGCIPAIAACWRLCTSYVEDIAQEGYKRGGRGGVGEGGRKEEEEEEEEERTLSLKEYVKEAKKKYAEATVEASHEKGEGLLLMGYVNKIFVDLSTPYSRRLSELRIFLAFNDKYAYHLLQLCMRVAFKLLYSKQRARFSLLGFCLQSVLPFLALASVVLFAKSHKDGYDDKDVKVTYILFCCTAVQEFIPWIPSILCFKVEAWHDMICQYSIMSFCARKKKPTILMKLATSVCLREYVNKHWYVRQVPAAPQITELVRRHVKDGWNEYICDAASYRAFNNLRGQRTLRMHSLGGRRRLGWSLMVPFDESVLLWHIATDLCFHHPANTSPPFGPQHLDAARRGREISNYMIYLLVIHPEMLMPGARPDLFTIAGDEIGGMLKIVDEPQPQDERSVALRILWATRFPWLYAGRIRLVPDACRLAEALMELLKDEKKRWEVIQSVWVEMLCYCAPRCRGYLHAQSLGEGGEYLTYVSLLLSFMGIETLADMIYKPGPPDDDEEEEEKNAAAGGASASPAQDSVGQAAENSSGPV